MGLMLPRRHCRHYSRDATQSCGAQRCPDMFALGSNASLSVCGHGGDSYLWDASTEAKACGSNHGMVGI